MTEPKQNEYMSLIQEHEGIIHKVINLYLYNSEDKHDLYQEVLLQGWRSFRNFKGQSTFSTWLYKVALNTVLTFNKKHQRKEGLEEVMDMEASTEKKENHEVLYVVIRSLEEIDRMLITLHLDGYKNKEIAEITGMTTNNINVKIHRIKGKIIEKFKKVNHG